MRVCGGDGWRAHQQAACWQALNDVMVGGMKSTGTGMINEQEFVNGCDRVLPHDSAWFEEQTPNTAHSTPQLAPQLPPLQ